MDYLTYQYDESITESTPTSFSGKFKINSSLSSALFFYDNSNYSMTISSLGNNIYNFSREITSPTVDQNENYTWYFSINGIDATKYNQTVVDVKLDDCSSYGYNLINYTLVDEETEEEINNANSTIEAQVILKSKDGTEVDSYNETFKGNPTPTICSKQNLTESDVYVFEQSRYGSDNYVYEQHNYQIKPTNSLPLEIILRDLSSDKATTFRITYKSESFLPVEEAILEVQRKYIGQGTFKEVESPLTDSKGQANAQFDLNSVTYRIVVKKDGEILSTFENPAISCDNVLTGECTISLTEREAVEQLDQIDNLNNFSYSLKQENKTIKLSYEITTNENKNVVLFVNQSGLLGNKTNIVRNP